MTNLNSTTQNQGCFSCGHFARLAVFKLIPLLVAAALAGCGGSRLDPFSGIQPGGKGLRPDGNLSANRADSPKTPRKAKGKPGSPEAGAGATAGGAAAGGTNADGTNAGGATAGGAAGAAGGNTSAGGGQGGASDSADDVIRSKIGGADASSSSDGTDGATGAGGRSADGTSPGARGKRKGAAGGGSDEGVNGAGGNAAGAAGANKRKPGSDAAGSDSANADGSNGSSSSGNRRGAGAGGNAAGGAGDTSSGAGGDSAAGAGGQRRGQGNAGGGANDSAAGDSMGGGNASGEGQQNAGAGGQQGTGVDGQARNRSGVGVGVGEAGVEDEDKRIAAIEVPNSNVRIDEDFKPQTLGGMLPLVLGVNEEGRFDFDQYALRDDVKGILDDLADKLKSAEFDRLDIFGYTDRIGNTQYNQRLSELRAWAVAQYLIHKGIPDNKVYYEGRGQKDPLTQAGECSGLARDELINCLQKDRRVEIEASIRRKHATVTQ